jgi:acetoacetyl-CoA synthetase
MTAHPMPAEVATPSLPGDAGSTEELASPPKYRIREVVAGDIDFLCDFLHSGFGGSRITAEAWRALFDYTWRPAGSSLGYVMTAGNEIVGFIGTVCAQREIRGKTGIVCNRTSWYVRPEHRGAGALALFMASLRDRALSYTDFTPSDVTVQMLRRTGFMPLSQRRHVLPALSNLGTLLGRRPFISFDPTTVRARLDAGQRRIFDDHSPYGCLHGVVAEGDDYAYIVTKRRVWRLPGWARPATGGVGVPYSMILHCSVPGILERHLERIKLAILARQRTVGIVADGGMFRRAPKGFSKRARTFYRSAVFAPGDLDGLYSELVLLPP